MDRSGLRIRETQDALYADLTLRDEDLGLGVQARTLLDPLLPALRQFAKGTSNGRAGQKVRAKGSRQIEATLRAEVVPLLEAVDACLREHEPYPAPCAGRDEMVGTVDG